MQQPQIITVQIDGTGAVAVFGGAHDWVRVQFVPAAIPGDWFLALDTLRGSSQAMLLMQKVAYDITLPPDTRLYVSNTNAAGTVGRIDFFISPPQLSAQELADIKAVIQQLKPSSATDGRVLPTVASLGERQQQRGIYDYLKLGKRG